MRTPPARPIHPRTPAAGVGADEVDGYHAILVDGKVATATGIARLVNNSVREASATTIGGAKVARGKRTLKLQASECTVGMAYLVSESMTVTFSPSGGAGTPPAFRGDGH